MNHRYLSLPAAILCAALAGPALAQDQGTFVKAFSGKWFIFDKDFGAAGNTCTVDLGDTPSKDAGRMPVGTQDCAAPLSAVDAWDIDQGQLRLFAGDEQIATLGGNQRRITGDMTQGNAGLIFERQEGSPDAATLARALSKHRCFFLGFGSDCARPEDLRRPDVPPDGGTAQVSVLVNLNVRDQPRANAPVVGTVPTGSCVKVNDCTVASDGIWCRARFGERAGWLRKTALRQDEWPVVTFTDTCKDQD